MSDSSFEIDVTVLLERLAKATQGIHRVGKALDNLEVTAQSVTKNMSGLATSTAKMYQNLGKNLSKTEQDNAALQNTLAGLEFTARATLDSIAQANQKAAIQAKHYADNQSVLNQILRDTDSMQAYIRHQRAMNLESDKQQHTIVQLQSAIDRFSSSKSTQIRQLQQQLKLLQQQDNKEAKQVQRLHEARTALEQVSSAREKEIRHLQQQTALATLREKSEANQVQRLAAAKIELEQVSSAREKEIRQVQQQITLAKQQNTAEDKQVQRLQAAKIALEQATSAREKEIRALERQRTEALASEQYLAKQQQTLQRLVLERNNADSSLTKSIQKLQREAAVRQEATTYVEKQAAAQRQLVREVENFNSPLATSIRNLTRQRDALRASEAAEHELRDAIAKTTRELQRIGTAEDIRLRQLKLDKQLKEDAANATSRLALEEAKLARELAHVRSEQGRRMILLKQQIVEETKALKEGSEATKKKTAQTKFGAQAAAALRAGLNGLQTSIGMYTSSTILAASATYALMRALRSTVVVGAEFQATMARTQAIMGNTVPASARAEVFKGMEQQIRALGKSTQFTATEVAKAMTELGQAGLSAGEAMIALSPTLDLAIIGQLDMARAADHVTNIMMIFGKEAKDLTDIVDVLAVAVTNSNTNIDQLANALTYAGPAADTAGFSFKDTVAAVEALANSGFKASRAGTALRRLFVSLANPTKKGQKVLDDLGVSVTDLEGNTRSLTSVVNQLADSLSGLTDTEQLTAIQNLVGVYAASPIAALVKQAETLNHLRNQLNYTGDAASKMRKEIEAALKFDYKTAVSAFQEAQLSAFSTVEYRLQSLTINAAKWLSELTNPIATGSSITHLDMLIEKMITLGKVIGVLAGVWLSGKMVSGLSAMGAQLATAGTALGTFSTQMLGTSKASAVASLAYTKTSTSLSVMTGSLSAAAAGTGYLAKGLQGVIVAAGVASAALRALFVAAPWIMGMYAAYEVFNTFFSSGSEEKIRSKRTEVDELARSYLQVKENIQAAADQEGRLAAKDQIKNLRKSIKDYEQELRNWEQSRKIAEQNGSPLERFDSEINAITRQIQTLEKTITELQKKAKDPLLMSVPDESRKLIVWQQQIQILDDEYRLALQNAANGTRISVEERITLEQEYFRKRFALQQKMREFSASETSQAKAIGTLIQENTKYLEDQRNAYINAEVEKNLTDVEKATKLRAEANAKLVEYHDLMTKISAKVKDGGMVSEGDSVKLNALAQALARAEEAAYSAEFALKDFSSEIKDTEKAIKELYMSEDEKLKSLQDELNEVITLRAANITLALAEGGAGVESATMQEIIAKSLADELALRQRIKQITDSQNKSRGGRGPRPERDSAAQKLEQELQSAESALESLRQKFDPLTYAQNQMSKGLEQLELLQKHGKITTEDYTLAVVELRKAYYQTVIETDKYVKSAEDLRSAHLSNGMGKAAEDMWKLAEAYKAGAVTAEEFAAITAKMQKDVSDSVNSLPEAKFELGNNSGPFLDHLKFVSEQAAETEKFTKFKEDLLTDTSNQLIAFDAERQQRLIHLEQIYQDEAMYKAKKDELDKEYAEKEKAVMQQKNAILAAMETRRLEYEKQSRMLAYASLAGSMADTLGLIADASENATTMQKVAFAAQKSLAVAQILLHTHVAAAKAQDEGGTFLGMSLATAIMAQGYASAGLVAGMAIGELSGGSKGFAGMYDKGGYIPDGQYGIVGEYGPEIVNGPAHVTGREDTARKLGKGGDTITIAPEIHIEYTSEGSGEDDRANATMMANTVKAIVVDVIKDQLRPNGMLARR